MPFNQCGLRLSRTKYKELKKNAKPNFLQSIVWGINSASIDQRLFAGDTQPATVVSTSPLIISAYSEDMDAVVYLRYPDFLAEKYSLEKGMRLVTSNYYDLARGGRKMAEDIFPGEDYDCDFINFTPHVQLFLADNDDFIRGRVKQLDESLWGRAEKLTAEYGEKHPGLMRDGLYPFYEVTWSL